MSARTMRLMHRPADFATKPPKSFARSELIRSIYERFQRNRGDEEGPRLKRRAQAESLVTRYWMRLPVPWSATSVWNCAASGSSPSKKARTART